MFQMHVVFVVRGGVETYKVHERIGVGGRERRADVVNHGRNPVRDRFSECIGFMHRDQDK